MTHTNFMKTANGIRDTFIDMMKTFVGNAPDGQTRYGINGWWGHLMLQSSGSPIVKYEDGNL